MPRQKDEANYFAHEGVIYCLKTGMMLEDTNTPNLTDDELAASWERLRQCLA